MSQSHAYDVISDSPVAVPSANVLLFGWVCADRSFLNNNRQSFARAYGDGFGKSACTFASCCAYLKKHQPQLALGENVTSLDDGESPEAGIVVN